jgi:hypothetical protein
VRLSEGPRFSQLLRIPESIGISRHIEVQNLCCGHSFCELCYDYHAAHAYVKKPVQSESNPIPTFRPAPARIESYFMNGAQKGADHIPKTDFTGT